MDIIPPEEAAKIAIKKGNRGTHVPGKNYVVWETLAKMEVGQVLRLDVDEWHAKSHPGDILHSKDSKKRLGKFSVSTLLDGSGWLITLLSPPQK